MRKKTGFGGRKNESKGSQGPNSSNTGKRGEGSRRSSGRTSGKFSKTLGSKSKGQSFRPRNTDDGKIRLNKFIANAGICSRRDADELIKEGKISVNGTIITELGIKVGPQDRVKFEGKNLMAEKPVYVLLNKPKDYISTVEDPQGRKTVMDLIKRAAKERIYPVGRLDRNTTGLLMFTNDGELSSKLTHPSFKIKKIYQVTLDRPISGNDVEIIKKGVTLDDGLALVDDIQVLSKDRRILGMEIHIGRNRIVRRIFEHLEYEVTQLDRVMLGPLDKRDLARGKWRHLSEKEVNLLKNVVK